jgi:hypothetical protein
MAFISILCLSCRQRLTEQIEPMQLKCEYSECPLGIENYTPRLSWILQSDKRSQKQHAYRILVAGSKENLDKNIGDHVLDPAQTDYEHRTFYVIYDVTNNLKPGENAIGILLGNGWYNQSAVNHGKYGWKNVIYGKPRFIFQMRLLYSDSTEMMIISDETWKGCPGPVVSDNVYAGEVYDPRLEQEGWAKLTLTAPI